MHPLRQHRKTRPPLPIHRNNLPIQYHRPRPQHLPQPRQLRIPKRRLNPIPRQNPHPRALVFPSKNKSARIPSHLNSNPHSLPFPLSPGTAPANNAFIGSTHAGIRANPRPRLAPALGPGTRRTPASATGRIIKHANNDNHVSRPGQIRRRYSKLPSTPISWQPPCPPHPQYTASPHPYPSPV